MRRFKRRLLTASSLKTSWFGSGSFTEANCMNLPDIPWRRYRVSLSNKCSGICDFSECGQKGPGNYEVSVKYRFSVDSRGAARLWIFALVPEREAPGQMVSLFCWMAATEDVSEGPRATAMHPDFSSMSFEMSPACARIARMHVFWLRQAQHVMSDFTFSTYNNAKTCLLALGALIADSQI